MLVYANMELNDNKYADMPLLQSSKINMSSSWTSGPVQFAINELGMTLHIQIK